MRRSVWLVVLVAAVSLAAPAAAPAPPASTKAEKKVVKLVYARLTGASVCPTPKTTEEAVAARLGYDPFKPDAKEVIEVFVAPGKTGGLSAVMRLLDAAGREQGKRELSSPSRDCGELSSALQLAIAIAVDPQSFMGGPATPPIPVAEALPPPPPPPLVQATPETSRLHFNAGLGVVGLLGSAPQATGGLALRLSLGGERFSVSVDGRADLPQSLDIGPGRASVSTITGLVAPCFHLGFAGACAVAGGGAVRVSSFNLVDGKDQTAPLILAGARLRADWNFSKRLSLAVSVDGLVPITRTILTASGQQVWSAPPIMVVGGVLLVIHVT